MTRFLIGAGGWAYFQVPSEDSLSAYAKTFNFVEVNSTFYEYPEHHMVRSWRKRTPADFEFTVRCHRDVTHKHRLEPSNENVACLERMVDICSSLDASIIHMQIPQEIEFDKRVTEFRDLLHSVHLGDVRIALETARGKANALGSQGISVMKDLNVIHCVDLSQEEPAYESDIVYTRLFGPKDDNVYQFSDEELTEINTKASEPRFEKSILAFHGVKMYKDAARLRIYRGTGTLPMVTSSQGLDSLREILSEDATFPTAKNTLIADQGWKIMDQTAKKRIHAETTLSTLPDRQYYSVDDVISALKQSRRT